MLLHLETATEICSAALSHNGQLLGYKESAEPRAHAAVLTVFIDELLTEAGIDATGVDAVSISAGPGSYTGLRIASSVAKGFCYAAGKPLIALDTLSIMADGFIQENSGQLNNALICPMIDARRDEVYTAVYNTAMDAVLPPAPLILTAQSYNGILTSQAVWFIGNGSEKFAVMLGSNPQANFNTTFYPKASHQIAAATQRFLKGKFDDVAYFEPNYLKEFYSTSKPKAKS